MLANGLNKIQKAWWRQHKDTIMSDCDCEISFYDVIGVRLSADATNASTFWLQGLGTTIDRVNGWYRNAIEPHWFHGFLRVS
jgi:hypothetical protein